jgi:hypothetical protein
MTITLTELFERLKQVDETSLLEILDISSEDIVDRFQDLIEEKYDTLSPEFTDQEEA